MSAQTPKVVLVGDRSLDSPHFGCQLVGETFREQFARTGLNLIGTLPIMPERVLPASALLDHADLVVVNGEGSTHNGRLSEMIRLAGRWPSVMVNCVYQNNPLVPELAEYQYVSARESFSAQAIREHGVSCNVVPDVIFASSLLNSFVRPEPTHDLGTTDNARKSEFRFGPLSLRFRPGFSPKSATVAHYLARLCRYRRLCIGRFHAAVAACVLGIPFASWDSNTWKTAGMMQDMGLAHLHFANREEAMCNVPTEPDPRMREFALAARSAIERLFDRIASIARENQSRTVRRAA